MQSMASKDVAGPAKALQEKLHILAGSINACDPKRVLLIFELVKTLGTSLNLPQLRFVLNSPEHKADAAKLELLKQHVDACAAQFHALEYDKTRRGVDLAFKHLDKLSLKMNRLVLAAELCGLLNKEATAAADSAGRQRRWSQDYLNFVAEEFTAEAIRVLGKQAVEKLGYGFDGSFTTFRFQQGGQQHTSTVVLFITQNGELVIAHQDILLDRLQAPLQQGGAPEVEVDGGQQCDLHERWRVVMAKIRESDPAKLASHLINTTAWFLPAGLVKEGMPRLIGLRQHFLQCGGSLLSKICTATCRLSSVLVLLAAIDPDLDFFSLEDVELVQSGVKIPGMPGDTDSCVAIKQVSGRTLLDPTCQEVPASVRGGAAIIFDANGIEWRMPSGNLQHQEVKSGRLACTALAVTPGIWVHSTRGITQTILDVANFLQARLDVMGHQQLEGIPALPQPSSSNLWGHAAGPPGPQPRLPSSSSSGSLHAQHAANRPSAAAAAAGADSSPHPMDWAPAAAADAAGPSAAANNPSRSGQPHAPPSIAAAGHIMLSEIKQLIFQLLQSGTLSLKPGAVERALKELELIDKTTAGLALLQQLLMGHPGPWVDAALQLSDVVWKDEVEALLAHWAGGQGVAGVLNVGGVRGPTAQEADGAREGAREDARGRQQQQKQQQQQQKLVSFFYRDVAVLLPAGLHLNQQQRAEAVRFGVPESFGEFSLSSTQQLHSPALLFTVCESSSRTYKGRKTPAQLTAMRTKQQELSQPLLEQRVYATLAGLLMWQLPWQLTRDQRQLLTQGSFARLQVSLTDGDKPVPAKPSVGLRGQLGTMGVE